MFEVTTYKSFDLLTKEKENNCGRIHYCFPLFPVLVYQNIMYSHFLDGRLGLIICFGLRCEWKWHVMASRSILLAPESLYSLSFAMMDSDLPGRGLVPGWESARLPGWIACGTKLQLIQAVCEGEINLCFHRPRRFRGLLDNTV